IRRRQRFLRLLSKLPCHPVIDDKHRRRNQQRHARNDRRQHFGADAGPEQETKLIHATRIKLAPAAKSFAAMPFCKARLMEFARVITTKKSNLYALALITPVPVHREFSPRKTECGIDSTLIRDGAMSWSETSRATIP